MVLIWLVILIKVLITMALLKHGHILVQTVVYTVLGISRVLQEQMMVSMKFNLNLIFLKMYLAKQEPTEH